MSDMFFDFTGVVPSQFEAMPMRKLRSLIEYFDVSPEGHSKRHYARALYGHGIELQTTKRSLFVFELIFELKKLKSNDDTTCEVRTSSRGKHHSIDIVVACREYAYSIDLTPSDDWTTYLCDLIQELSTYDPNYVTDVIEVRPADNDNNVVLLLNW